MIDLTTNELIEGLRERLRRAEKVGDWVDAAHDGELLTSSQAAEVADVTAETVRHYAESAEAAGRPIGYNSRTFGSFPPRLNRAARWQAGAADGRETRRKGRCIERAAL
jgi:hypothetical protein